uniref:AlNc14C169G7960 protein n=1 Tax=Albugo laibachii Nc14 TaxID=890382 RepID=F0WND0_9STRA|nr:AlNc14C169G7960 [Albugo laibachii Nc14]|eukprot:CCA22821.1 AlNc14C169G7960 [Albugo laibachii Nc14]
MAAMMQTEHDNIARTQATLVDFHKNSAAVYRKRREQERASVQFKPGDFMVQFLPGDFVLKADVWAQTKSKLETQLECDTKEAHASLLMI